jgi:hypothetical protein
MAEQARHRVVLNFDDGLRLKLICPETGCRPATQCGECYRHVDDEEREPCGACPGSRGHRVLGAELVRELHVRRAAPR